MKWIDPPDIEVPAALQAGIGGHHLVSHLLARRGLSDLNAALAFLHPDRYQETPPTSLPGMAQSADALSRAQQIGKKICVWGDFDVDGQTSTTLLVSALRGLGADVVYHIPVRESESHGISVPVLEKTINEGFGVLLTCDTGITAHEAVALAISKGIEVVITDHHDLPEILPSATAIIDPKMLPTDHPLASLPGVGVAYKLAQELFSRLRPDASLDGLLDLVALGIVADVAVLQGDVRFLLQRGLHVLRSSRRTGLAALMKFINLPPASLTEEHIAFALAPRLNALGRLSDTNIMVDFLTTSDPLLAQKVTLDLEKMNNQRRLLTEQVLKGALTQLERDPSLRRHAALVLANPSWHSGVLGPVASRLVEIYNKPCILLRSPPGEDARGSARSVEGCDISSALRANGHLLHSYGGHPMAAGLSLSAGDIPALRVSLSRTIHELTGVDEVEPSLRLDAWVDLSELTDLLLQDVERLAPFGPGNPQPLFGARNVVLSGEKAVGRDKEHLILTVEDQAGSRFKVIRWRGAGMELPQGRFDLAYHAHLSGYQGREMSLVWVDAHPAEGSPIYLAGGKVITVIDHRHEPHPLAVLKGLPDREKIQIWTEGEGSRETGGTDRTHLQTAEELVIWTTPPSRPDLESVLELVSPRVIHLICVDPPERTFNSFLILLLGMSKHMVNRKEGKASLASLAGAAAQRQETIRLGLDLLAGEGQIEFSCADDGTLHLRKGKGLPKGRDEQLLASLKILLDETSAYRNFFRSEPVESIHPRFILLPSASLP